MAKMVTIDAQELDLLRQDVDRAIREFKRLRQDICNLIPDDLFGPRKKITREFLEECVRKKYANNDTKGQADSGSGSEAAGIGVQGEGQARTDGGGC